MNNETMFVLTVAFIITLKIVGYSHWQRQRRKRSMTQYVKRFKH